MDYYELIQSRESIRNYDPDRPVPENTLKKILDAGRLAPSARNIQPWKFLVVSSREMLGKLRECYPRDWFRDAPHILVVAGMKDKAWTRSWDGYNSIETDLAIAMTHILLAAANEGVGTCWVAAYNPEVLRQALELEESEVVYGITPLGFPKPEFVRKGAKNRKSLDEIAEFL
ncbi:MAG TPA: nitroreductase family protein [Bacteroidales bacterium]|jgi:nitroreductase|nr:nitroreductase family protein [Bacteroidales bacterium]HOS71407.1 nitroreductase family protein [Bacteroidales bacterium]HQH23714.1 nitroreductase family protein [Bacteroidales bacterium]HQJ82281.1 nitroreductase family protein [Bacteroidales bacterium]